MKETFIMPVGFAHSGKTTLIQKIKATFPDFFNEIDSDTIHNFLNTTYPVFKDDNTIEGKSYKLRNETTKKFQMDLIETLVKNGDSLILGACNLALEKRTKILNKIEEVGPKFQTIIIYVKIPEEKLLRNLEEADEKYKQNGKKPGWVELYEKVQKKKFVEPKAEEADYFITYNWENTDEVMNELKKIIE